VGESPEIKHVLAQIDQVTGTDATVMIIGETGTGKELVARATHYNSSRKNNRFVPVNCGAISKELIEAELFGYVKGAFTGAVRDKTGFLELASGGTLFLDEIGETTPDFQVKLLRVLQEGEFNKVGSPYATRVNVRIIAATNRNLTKAMAEGIFREDLFYRLNVISIHIPSLRQRREDIPLLVLHFIEKYSKKREDNKVSGITPSAMEALINHNYPGNVRELENAVEYAVAFAHTYEITTDDLPKSIRVTEDIMPKIHFKPLKAARVEFERNFVSAALKECGSNISKTARLLDMHRQSLQQKIKELDIKFEELKED
jgi:transcriptional regulator with PAS, ATPase and Fis domain